jgi:hypothetical protein
MKKKIKKFASAILGGVLLAQAMFGAVIAFASNTSDTSWGYSSDGENVFMYNGNNGYTFETEARRKEDGTSIYVRYVNGSVGAIRVYPYKCNSTSKAGGQLAIYRSARNDYEDYYVYTVDLQRTMYNDVHETGYLYSFLRVNTFGVSGWAIGFWSPDSTHEYN